MLFQTIFHLGKYFLVLQKSHTSLSCGIKYKLATCLGRHPHPFSKDPWTSLSSQPP